DGSASVISSAAGPAATKEPTAKRRPQMLPWLAAGFLAAALAGAVIVWAPWRHAPPQVPVRLTVDVGADTSILPPYPDIALSPDGTALAFVGVDSSSATQLYVRRLGQLQATMLPSADGALMPFFSPDGQWIGFFAAGKLKKVAVAGGAAVT